MDSFKAYIGMILNGVHLSKARRMELEEEILDHLEMLKEEQISSGCSTESAEKQAIKLFGDIDFVNKRYKIAYSSYNRLRGAINRKKKLKESLSWAFTIALVIVISMTLRSYAFAAPEIQQGSMESTLYEGQRLIEWKVEYYFSDPQRGDIVIINTETEKDDFLLLENTKEFFGNFFDGQKNDFIRLVKRVIGIPGDKIDIIGGKVYINDELYDESYVTGETYSRSMTFPIEIPENYYFVMGDNREYSMDSRDLGLISIEKIEGKAVFRFWPLDKIGTID